VNSRREFIARGCQLAAVASLPVSALAALPEVAEAHACSARISLTGVWQFQLDPDRTGETKLWHKPTAGPDWLAVEVPHTWHIQKDLLPASTLRDAKLWHFDHPHLYRLRAVLTERDQDFHALESTFGVRSIEIKDAGFYLNDMRVWLAGVERMAGSNPEFGIAEPAAWLTHDHDDLKKLNCVFTRVHWQQDRRVLEYCDRHGILIQTEVPTWGPDTFEGMGNKPAAEIMENGIEQLREMIARDRNHPCIFSWGLCNEINGQNPPAYEFAKGMLEEAKKLDPRRLCSYASNSLQSNASKDVSGLMDFVEGNEYYESWYKGTPADLRSKVQEIHEAFPVKPIVISEYGYCACTPERPEGDARRIEVLREHNRVFREREYVGGLIFFCCNDYRIHIGDKGVGVMKQRIHGVVDLYGNRKPSWTVLRYESSPIESLAVEGSGKEFTIRVRTRKTAPAYTLDGYKLQAVLYGYSEIPLERYEAPLPRLAPGAEAKVSVQWKEKEPVRVVFDVQRPTGFSAFHEELDNLRAPARSWKIRYAASSGTLGAAPPSANLV
jgi:beta-galactosidase